MGNTCVLKRVEKWGTDESPMHQGTAVRGSEYEGDTGSSATRVYSEASGLSLPPRLVFYDSERYPFDSVSQSLGKCPFPGPRAFPFRKRVPGSPS